jgi:hypothetical protein
MNKETTKEYPYDLIGFKNKNSQNSEYEVINFIKFKNNGTRRYAYYKVRFDTGHEREARRDAIKSGEVKNPDVRTNLASRLNENDFIGFKRENTAGEPFEVISFEGRCYGKMEYKVRFLNTGNEKVHTIGFVGYKGTNNQGEDFEVIGKNPNITYTYLVKFKDTGYEREFTKECILRGNIKDLYYPAIYGVACCGEISTLEPGTDKGSREYYMWYGMISRCYNPKHKYYSVYGGAGITVCDRWLCYENFFHDIQNMPNYTLWKTHPGDYELDKDTLQVNIDPCYKVYSPETCMFISSLNNNLEHTTRVNLSKDKYLGAHRTSYNTYKVLVGGEYYGTYSDEIAAANMYNHVARLRGYPDRYLNQGIPFMPVEECVKYKSNVETMCEIVDNNN